MERQRRPSRVRRCDPERSSIGGGGGGRVVGVAQPESDGKPIPVRITVGMVEVRSRLMYALAVCTSNVHKTGKYD